MNENEFGQQVARLLQSGLKDVDDATSAKLKSARLAALAHYGEKAPVQGLVWSSTLGERFGGLFQPRPLLWAPLVALLLALALTGYWQYRQRDVDDVDASLLAGDLPIQAYIDKDFDAWLKGYSR